MRTRRSFRNQERLFKGLFKPTEQPLATAPILTDAEIDAMWWVSKTSRNMMKRDAAKKIRSSSASARKA